jgi:hypothetical protein
MVGKGQKKAIRINKKVLLILSREPRNSFAGTETECYLLQAFEHANEVVLRYRQKYVFTRVVGRDVH